MKYIPIILPSEIERGGNALHALVFRLIWLLQFRGSKESTTRFIIGLHRVSKINAILIMPFCILLTARLIHKPSLAYIVFSCLQMKYIFPFYADADHQVLQLYIMRNQKREKNSNFLLSLSKYEIYHFA